MPALTRSGSCARTAPRSRSAAGKTGGWSARTAPSLAFVLNSKLYVARIGPAGMAVRSSTGVPADTWPIEFFGDQVVISVDNRGFDLVDPGQPYRPSWNTDLTAVLGARGNLLVGLVRRSGAAGYCLGDIRAAGAELRVERTGGCALELAGGTPGGPPVGRLSPNGAWLAEQRDGGVALINVNRAMRDTSAGHQLPGRQHRRAGLGGCPDRGDRQRAQRRAVRRRR